MVSRRARFGGERGDRPLDPGAHALDGLVPGVQVGEALAHEERMGGRKRPARAGWSAGTFFRSLPRANSARRAGSVVPWTRASSIARPETPRLLVASEASLMPAAWSTL